MLGDSLTAGYGLKATESLPPRLGEALARLGCEVRVIGAGVSGDTTRDGLARMDRDVPHDADLCIVALGANDMMQLIPVETVRANLNAILRRLETRGVPALLCGMRAPPWLGAYAWIFDAAFDDVARAAHVPLMPFLLEGVAFHSAYVLADGIHPNAKGVSVIAERLAPHVLAALKK